MKYKAGDIVIVHKKTPTFHEGAVCRVIDRDPLKASGGGYAVCPLEDYGKYKHDMGRVYDNVKWVAEENMTKIVYEKASTQMIKSIACIAGIFLVGAVVWLIS
jgi:hypothetical protein